MSGVRIPSSGDLVGVDQVGPLSIFDTVAVDLPRSSMQGKIVVFGDPTGKELQHTNMRHVRRLPLGWKLRAKSLEIDVRHWSGDDVEKCLWNTASLSLYLGSVLCLYQGPLPKTPISIDEEINDRVDINCHLRFDPAPWPEQTEVVLEEKPVVADEELHWPEFLRTSRFARYLPRMRTSRTTWEPVTRRREGVMLVRVALVGQGSVPLAT